MRNIRLTNSIVLTVALIAIAFTTTHAQTTANKFTEREVTFAGHGGFQLHGTLVAPATKGKVPGILLLPGSGPSDRNGNQPPGLITDLLKQIAERLAADGYASLRFDKRAAHGYAGSWPKDIAGLNDFFSWDSFVGDARAGFEFLKSQPEVNPKQTVIAGHSEGATIAMQVVHDFEGFAG